MTAQLATAVCTALYFAHAWILLGHRQKMGSDSSDSPQDPMFTQASQAAAFVAILSTLGTQLYRRIAIAMQIWHPTTSLEQLIDFLPLAANDLTLAGGILVFLSGFALRVWAIRLLGRFFTFEIGIRAKHRIIEIGPYRYIRHPSYTGYLMLVAGLGLAYASLFWLVGGLLASAAFLLTRIRQEERMLERHFGQPYRDYAKRTKKLIPYVY